MENQEQQAENERREEKKRQEKFRRMQQKVENELRSVSRQDPPRRLSAQKEDEGGEIPGKAL